MLDRRASPPATRVVAVLDYLARHPDQRFGLSELARRVGLSKPTCLGILTTLTESGYLIRETRDKTYRLGPALIALGHAAQESLRASPAAHDELRRLSAGFSTTAALSAVVDDRITLLDLVAPPGATEPVRVGQSYPFAPPIGLMFVLWDDESLRDWLAKQPTVPLRADTDRLHRIVTECRASGYFTERLTPAGRRLYTLMAGLSADLPEELQALLGELVSDIGERAYLRGEDTAAGRQGHSTCHDISVIAAPVYDRHRRQVMVVSLQVYQALSDAEITRWAGRLIASADALTAQLGGQKPTFG